MHKLKKTLEELNRELNDRKAKVIKPIITEVREMISSIDDSNKKLEYKISKCTESI